MKTHRGVKVNKSGVYSMQESASRTTKPPSWRHSLAFDFVVYELDLRGGDRATRSAYNIEVSEEIDVEMTDFRGV